MKIGGETVQIKFKYQFYFSLCAGFVYSLILSSFYFLLGEDIQIIPFVFRALIFTVCWYLIFFKLLHRKQKVTFSKENLDSVAFYGVAYQTIKTLSHIGVLYATDKQLIFEPKTKNFVENQWMVDWKAVEKVRVYRFLSWFDYGIIIQTKGKMKFKFVVNEPQVWLQAIQTKIES
ncbi:hypothetical protein [Myroides odoratus]|uniref:Uncharacterized protein n=1 Tax=Myroides odoratus TaxID=256 RepID=A0A378RMJ8_MYROD|nr:hypothetical protein [Myroides odoratus]QQU04342.1 hypothetical protein I6I89_03395 [Myroides odoratus]STZ28236.1 Uncharacterised protein [Myroides odoratus]